MAEKEREQSKTDEKNRTRADKRFIKEHGEELSDTTTKYGKWVHSSDEHEDKPGQSLVTRSHEVIQRWADERKAVPSTVPETGPDDRPGVLRFNFPGYGGDRLEAISWEDFFRVFDERKLVFLFQEHKSDGSQSNFFRFDNPEREDA